jgi:vacuolar-type H+-ATPase subunit H
MSGIETVKVIVEAEKEAAKILADAQTRAREIRKQLDSLIEEQREETIRVARKEATALVANAQSEAITEGQVFEEDTQNKMREALGHASARKGLAVEKLVSILVKLEV